MYGERQGSFERRVEFYTVGLSLNVKKVYVYWEGSEVMHECRCKIYTRG